jgi:N-hydroxyarylamine O-acetyltransferase
MRLQSYLDRIGCRGRPEPTLDCLRAIHRAQALTVPYENLDVQLGVPITTDIASIFDKVVTRRRGGWCYELNGLLGWALKEMGFEVARVAGGVMRSVRGDTAIGNHLVLLVEADGATWLCDLGLGDGLRDPIPAAAGLYRQSSLVFELAELPDGHWRFTNHAHAYPPDFDFRAEAADEAHLSARCLVLQTAPESGFVQNLIVQQMEADAVTCLTGRVLRRKSATGETKRLLNSAAELSEVLHATFGLSGVDTDRLWAKAAARHEVLFGQKSIEDIAVAGM